MLIQEWRPYPKQEIALKASVYELLYGGARGGGKTEAGIMWLLYPIDNPTYQALVIRQNFIDLQDWFDRASRVYCSPPFNAIARGRNEFVFPSGAKIKLGHLKDAQAYTKYQGHEYQRMLIEELTQIPTEALYLKLLASCRSTNGIRAQVFATCNPGEIGTSWVKKRFVEPATPTHVFQDRVSGRARLFIPATVDDNLTLSEKDPDYIKYLDSLPPDLRAWWRYGSWEEVKIKGSVFGDEIDQLIATNRLCEIAYNPNLPVFTAWDIGLEDHQVCWFFQLYGEEIRFIDLMADNNKSWDYWAQQLKHAGYGTPKVYLPHDGVKRSGDTLLSFRDKLVSAGYEVVINTRTRNKYNDIQEVRAMFSRFKFNEERCAEGLDHLKRYRYEWLEERAIFTREAVHDEASHFADALREAVIAAKKEYARSGGVYRLVEVPHETELDIKIPKFDTAIGSGYFAQHAQHLRNTQKYNRPI